MGFTKLIRSFSFNSRSMRGVLSKMNTGEESIKVKLSSDVYIDKKKVRDEYI